MPDLFPISFPGVKTSRDDVVVDIDRDRLVERMKQYFDPKISHEEMRLISPRAVTDAARFDAQSVREYLRRRGFLLQNMVPYCYRPFDVRWLYWEPETKLLDEKRSDYFPNVIAGNLWLSAVQHNRKRFDPPAVSRFLCSLHIIERGANLFPAYLSSKATHGPLMADDKQNPTSPNLGDLGEAYLDNLGYSVQELFQHVTAILHAPTYRRQNASALTQDWPRIPLPASKEKLSNSAALGKQIAALLDTETEAEVVRETALQKIAAFILPPETQLDETKHFAVTAGWGHAGKGGIAMPGKGKAIKRDYTEEERKAIAEAGQVRGLESAQALKILGDHTYDVYLNDVACWSNVPARVWEYTIGGYQVIKKWLSYREAKLLGRPLKIEEVRYVQEMARRIAAILLLEPELDSNYRQVKENTFAWKG